MTRRLTTPDLVIWPVPWCHHLLIQLSLQVYICRFWVSEFFMPWLKNWEGGMKVYPRQNLELLVLLLLKFNLSNQLGIQYYREWCFFQWIRGPLSSRHSNWCIHHIILGDLITSKLPFLFFFFNIYFKILMANYNHFKNK